MTLLLLFAAISGIWANNYLHLWENGQKGNFYDMGGDNTCIITNLKANTTYGVLIFDRNTSDGATKWGATSDNQNSPMTVPCQNVTLGGHADFYFKTSVAGDYTFTATWDNGTPSISIVASPGSTGETAFYLVGDLPGAYWSINDNFKFSPDGTDYSITLKGSAVSGKQFKLKRKTGTTESYIAGPSSENKTITLDSPVAFTRDGGMNYVFPQLDSNAEYIMTLTMTSLSEGKFVVKKKDSSSAKYYLIVPNANVGNTNRYVPSEEFAAPAGHKAFRLKASRERNSTVINNDLTTLALKLDGRQLRYNTNGEIEFYIQSSDGRVYMQPKDNNDDTYIKLASNARNNVDYYATRTGTCSSNQNRYYKIHKNDINPTDGSVDTKTLVFMFSKDNASKTAHINNETDYNKNVPISKGNSIDGVTTGRYDTGKDLKYNVGKDGNLIVGFLMSRGAGSKYYEEHIKENGLYLVGSIAQKNYTHDKSHRMEKRYWKDGRIVELSDLGDDEAKADSIVYNCLVRNTGRSWDDFFLSFSTGDVVEGTGLWNLLLRPCVQDQMDAQELGGGVTFYQYDGGDKNNGQSLNPLLTAEQKARYVSYRVYFNATYSTYRIEFNDAFYIAGPAVNGSTDSGNSGTFFDKEHRYAMRKVTANGEEHYTYMGYFKKGGSFAFLVVNEGTTTSNYSEDENALKLEDGNAESAWKVQAPGNGGDYAFYNKVKWNNGTRGTDNEPLGTGNKAILWNLPDGYYTIRFYYGGTSGPKSDKTALYTVDKSVKISNVTVNVAETEKNYGGWMPFSDDCALWLPSNIKAYYAYDVKEETDGKKIVQLRELKGGYVPANCGVLLRNEDLTEKGAVERLNYMPVPAGYTKSFEDYKSEQGISDKNLLMDCSTTDKCVELDQVKDGYYNYFFTYKYKDADKNGGEFFDVPLNFWKVYPGEKPNKNSSYLRVAKQVTPLEFNVTDNNYYIADSEKVANSKGAYCLLFSIDDIDDNETTGIRVISPAADNDTNTDGWYNMQGMRVSKPTTAGIYINNGKKVVIK